MGCDISEERIKELEKIAIEDGASAAAQALALDLDPGFKLKFIEAWKAGLLSNPGTWGANFLSNKIREWMAVAETGVAGTLVDPLLAGGRAKRQLVEINSLKEKIKEKATAKDTSSAKYRDAEKEYNAAVKDTKMEESKREDLKTRLDVLKKTATADVNTFNEMDKNIKELEEKLRIHKGRVVYAGESAAMLMGEMNPQVQGEAWKKLGEELKNVLTLKPEKNAIWDKDAEGKYDNPRIGSNQDLVLGAKYRVDPNTKAKQRIEGTGVKLVGPGFGRLIRSPFNIMKAFDNYARAMSKAGALQRHAFRLAMHGTGDGIALRPGTPEHAKKMEKLVGDYLALLKGDSPKLKDEKGNFLRAPRLDDFYKTELVDEKTGKRKIIAPLGKTPEEVLEKAHKDFDQAERAWKKSLNKQFPGWFESITKTGEYETFNLPVDKKNQGALGSAAKWIDNFVRDHPWANAFLPFRRTLTNVAYQTYERTPLGFLGKGGVVDALWGKEADPEKIARALTGTMLMVTFAGMAKAGLITGSGPDDREKNENWIKAGNSPNSVLDPITGTWISYDRLEPFSTLVSAAANLVEMEKEKTSKGQALKVAEAMTDALTKTGIYQGLGKMVDLLRDPARYGETTLKGLAGSLVPGIVRKTAQQLDKTEEGDPIIRDTKGENFLESMRNKFVEGIPGASQSLPESKTGEGETRTRQRGIPVLGEPLSPLGFIKTEDARPEGVELERVFDKIGWVPGRPEDKIEFRGLKVLLAREDMAILDQVDQVVTKDMRRIVASPGFQRLAEYDQKRYLQGKYTGARSRVREMLKMKYLREGKFQEGARI